jgi:unsaturated chondroitin disaccharide hydrolase
VVISKTAPQKTMNQSRHDSPLWNSALVRMQARITDTAKMELHGFPQVSNPQTGEWTTVSDGDWTGGFWVGLLWLAYYRTRDEKLLQQAEHWAQRLRPRAQSQTVFRSFLFYYGAAIAAILLDNSIGHELGLLGAQELATLYNSNARLVPIGTQAPKPQEAHLRETNVDGLAAIALLGWAAERTGNKTLQQIGKAHATRHIELCVRDDGSVHQSARFDPNTGNLTARFTHKGYSDESTWARAQAWAMLGYVLAAKYASDEPRFLEVAKRVSDWWINHVPTDGVAYWDFCDPGIPNVPRDTSATAIALAALLKLSALTTAEERARYRRAAEETAKTLVLKYLTPVSERDERPSGMLTEGSFNGRTGQATRNELIWGNYFLFEALLVLAGILDPLAI